VRDTGAGAGQPRGVAPIQWQFAVPLASSLCIAAARFFLGSALMCSRYTTDAMLNEWNASRHLLCDNVYELAYANFQYTPTFRVFERPYLTAIDGNLHVPCDRQVNLKERGGHAAKWNRAPPPGRAPRTDYVVYRVCRADALNPYEALGALVNAYTAFKLFDLTHDVRVVVTDLGGTASNFDHEFWQSLSRHPVVYRDVSSRLRVDPVIPLRVVKAANSAASIVDTTSSDGVFSGRGTAHNCYSPFFVDAINWIRTQVQSRALRGSTYGSERGTFKASWIERRSYSSTQRDAYGVIRWLRRSPSVRVHGLQHAMKTLSLRLSPTWTVTKLHPESLSLSETIDAFGHTRLLIGVHGAGNTWLVFMPRGGYFIEIFGGDRDRRNRHYENLAALVGVHYRSLSPRNSICSTRCVAQIASFARTIVT
jgi:hypothetical protein